MIDKSCREWKYAAIWDLLNAYFTVLLGRGLRTVVQCSLVGHSRISQMLLHRTLPGQAKWSLSKWTDRHNQVQPSDDNWQENATAPSIVVYQKGNKTAVRWAQPNVMVVESGAVHLSIGESKASAIHASPCAFLARLIISLEPNKGDIVNTTASHHHQTHTHSPQLTQSE